MSISYDSFIKKIESKGITLHSLWKKGVINQHTYEAMSKNESIGLKWIDSICRHFQIPIEDVVEIKLESETPSTVQPRE